MNKIYSDYLSMPSPKGGFNVDVIRCLLSPNTVEDMLAIYTELQTYFADGIAKMKNLFPLTQVSPPPPPSLSLSLSLSFYFYFLKKNFSKKAKNPDVGCVLQLALQVQKSKRAKEEKTSPIQNPFI